MKLNRLLPLPDSRYPCAAPRSRAATACALLVALSVCAVVRGALATPISLGAAADFNAVVLGDMFGRNSDVEGRLAVGGNADLRDFSVGMLLPDSAGSRDDLIVGGDAAVRRTRMYAGNAVVGGSADFDETVGFYRDGGAPGSAGSVLTPPPASFPVDFASLIDDLLWRSDVFGGLRPTGDTQLSRDSGNDIWNITFRGDRRRNVFGVRAEDLSSPDKRITFDVPTDSVTLVNVFGSRVDLYNTGFYHTGFGTTGRVPDNTPTERHDGRFSNGILFNFVDATELNIHAVSLRGSVLAPRAAASFYDGNIDGNIIVGAFTTPEDSLTGQVNDYRFRGEVPAPTALVLIFTGLALLRLQGRQRCLSRGGAGRMPKG